MADRVRVAVSGHDFKFWNRLQSELEKSGRFEFRQDYWPGHNKHDPAVSNEMIDWADVLVAEWALGNAVYYAERKKPHQKFVTRLHLQERDTAFPAQIPYDKVDAIAFVGPHILDECVEKFSIPASKAVLVPNFVNANEYDLPKAPGSKFNLGLIGQVPKRKRLDLAVATLAYLLLEDDRYCLRVKGPQPYEYDWLWARTLEREYYAELYSLINSGDLRNKVIFDPPGDDIPAWFSTIGHILSPSDFESFHMAVAEGLCSGTNPVVWDWDGSQDIYRFFPTVSSPKQAAEWIRFSNSNQQGHYLRDQSRDYVQQNFSPDVVAQMWTDLLLSDSPAGPAVTIGEGQRTCLVVWAIDALSTFHRTEMLKSLAGHLEADTDIIFVAPGNHASTLVKADRLSREQAERFANFEFEHVGENFYSYYALTSGFLDQTCKAKESAASEPLENVNAAIHHNFGKRQITHWIYKPNQARMFRNDEKFLYEVYDDYTVDFGSGKKHSAVEKEEVSVIARADHVLFTSHVLQDRKSQAGTPNTLITNGVDFRIFDKYSYAPDATHRTGAKSVGYLGNMSNFFDWQTVCSVTREMPHLDFIFYGPVEAHSLSATEKLLYEEVCSRTNTYFPGRVAREQSAAGVARCDALIIPFVVNEAMHAVNPLKLWEYFAVGRPVISSPMDAIMQFEPHVRFAATPTEWIDRIEEAVHEPERGNTELYLERRDLARSMSWSSLTAPIAPILSKI